MEKDTSDNKTVDFGDQVIGICMLDVGRCPGLPARCMHQGGISLRHEQPESDFDMNNLNQIFSQRFHKSSSQQEWSLTSSDAVKCSMCQNKPKMMKP